jgi:hypothetical protein
MFRRRPRLWAMFPLWPWVVVAFMLMLDADYNEVPNALKWRLLWWHDNRGLAASLPSIVSGLTLAVLLIHPRLRIRDYVRDALFWWILANTFLPMLTESAICPMSHGASVTSGDLRAH